MNTASPAWLSPGVRDMALASLCFATMAALVKLVDARLSIAYPLLARAVVGLVASWWALRQRGLDWKGHRTGLLAFRGFIGFSALVCNFWSLSLMELSDAAVLHQTQPIWTALAAGLFLGEALNRRLGLASVIALVGVVLVIQPSFLFAFGGSTIGWQGPTLALVAAILAAGAYTSVRALRASDDPMVVVFWFALVSLPGASLAVALDPQWPSLLDWGLLLGIGLVTQAAQVLMTRAFHRENAARVSATGYLQVLFSYAFGLVLFGDSFEFLSLAGALFIVGGALLASAPQIFARLRK